MKTTIPSADAITSLQQNANSENRNWFRRLLSRVNDGSPNYPTFAGQALLQAACMGDNYQVETLLRSVQTPAVLQNALFIAAEHGKGSVIRSLLDHAWSRCKVAIPATVYIAVHYHRTAEVQMLMESPYRFKKSFFTSLINEVIHVDDDKVMAYVLSHMDQNRQLGWVSLRNAAFLCAQTRRPLLFATILPYLKPNDRSGVLNRALKYAAFSADYMFVMALLKAGANPFAQDSDALISAGAGGSIKIIELFLKLGGDPLARKGELLVQAAFFDRAEVVDYLLQMVSSSPTSISTTKSTATTLDWSPYYDRAMTAAVQGESVDVVELFCRRRIRLSPSLLQVAALQGNIQIFRCLDARLLSPPSILSAALMDAVSKNHVAIVGYLVKRGIELPPCYSTA